MRPLFSENNPLIYPMRYMWLSVTGHKFLCCPETPRPTDQPLPPPLWTPSCPLPPPLWTPSCPHAQRMAALCLPCALLVAHSWSAHPNALLTCTFPLLFRVWLSEPSPSVTPTYKVVSDWIRLWPQKLFFTIKASFREPSFLSWQIVATLCTELMVFLLSELRLKDKGQIEDFQEGC